MCNVGGREKSAVFDRSIIASRQPYLIVVTDFSRGCRDIRASTFAIFRGSMATRRAKVAPAGIFTRARETETDNVKRRHGVALLSNIKINKLTRGEGKAREKEEKR